MALGTVKGSIHDHLKIGQLGLNHMMGVKALNLQTTFRSIHPQTHRDRPHHDFMQIRCPDQKSRPPYHMMALGVLNLLLEEGRSTAKDTIVVFKGKTPETVNWNIIIILIISNIPANWI